MKRLTVMLWLNSVVVTPDARGEIIEVLNRRDDLPRTFPNCSYFYCFVRDRLKMTDHKHKSAAVALYDEYRAFKQGYEA